MLATLLAVSLYPVLRTIWLAFRNTSLETQGDKFTGLANVHRLASDAMFWKAWRQTLEFTAVTTIAEITNRFISPSATTADLGNQLPTVDLTTSSATCQRK